MESFFDCIRSAVTVALSIAALLTLHWSLLAASFVTTVIMLFVPKLFHRKMEHLGAICTREQSAGVNQPKELMSGYDVLCFFRPGGAIYPGGGTGQRPDGAARIPSGI